jgi:anti-sigma factor RsiW
MSECTNLEMRDQLPDFVRGALSAPSSVELEDHLATCAECRAELRLIRDARVVLSTTPSVDATHIVAAIARSTGLRRSATTAVAESRRRRAWTVVASSRRVWLAAASIVGVVGAAVLVSGKMRAPASRDLAPAVVQVEQPRTPTAVGTQPTAPVTSRPSAHAELVMGGGVSDLADADLESLLRALDDVDTQLDVEPAVVMPVLEGDV